jgi:hypothetical protein
MSIYLPRVSATKLLAQVGNEEPEGLEHNIMLAT